MKVLVLNCGSSTLKFQWLELAEGDRTLTQVRRLARGLVDRIGGRASCTFESSGSPPQRETLLIRNHEEAVRKVFAWLESVDTAGRNAVDAVGHRVVHGGDRFNEATLIDDEAIAAIESFNDLAPLHNDACLSGIRGAQAILGDSVPMIAVFDTAFHQTLPRHAATYAIPEELSERHKIRRYGFHGLAHRSTMLRYASLTKTPASQVNVVIFHLGNGCSATAIRGGKSIDTSMGFTPLEGLMMGTRCGDLDPSILVYLTKKEGVTADEVEIWLNNKSGLLGISCDTNDMRRLLEQVRSQENHKAKLAIEMFCYRARKYLGAYLAVVEKADAVIFSGGIGENAPEVREGICRDMEWCGLKLDPKRNAAIKGDEGIISTSRSRIKAFVIPADEELLIAQETASLLSKKSLSP